MLNMLYYYASKPGSIVIYAISKSGPKIYVKLAELNSAKVCPEYSDDVIL